MFRVLNLIIFFFISLTLISCSGKSGKLSDMDKMSPQDRERTRLIKEGGGSFLGDFGFGGDDDDGSSVGIGVNTYLWQSSLEVLSFMPLSSADPFGGVIITDWYATEQKPNERYKITVYISSTQLRADALKVSIFRQVSRSGSNWRYSKVSKKTALEIENTILTKASQIKTSSLLR